MVQQWWPVGCKPKVVRDCVRELSGRWFERFGGARYLVWQLQRALLTAATQHKTNRKHAEGHAHDPDACAQLPAA